MNLDIKASWRVKPTYFRAPWPEDGPFTPSLYQHAAVEYCISRRHTLIGDAPGLGKTAEALLFGNTIQAKRTLVICPASLRLNWCREIVNWSTVEDVFAYPVLKAKDGVSPSADYLVISYDLMSNPHLAAAIMDLRWDHLIIDEAHALKDPKGNKRTKVICAPDMLPSVVDRITLLTGTPMPNQPIEIYNAVRLLDWDAIDCMSVEAFRRTYYEEGGGYIRGPVLVTEKDGLPCEPHYVNKVHWSEKVRNVPRNLDDLQARLRTYIMVRRLKEDVLTQLPPKRWHVMPVENTKAIRTALKHPSWKQAEKLYELSEHDFDSTIPVDGAISTAMRLLGEAKAPLALEYIRELLDEGVDKILVGAWHRNASEDGVAGTGLSVLHFLRDRLKKYGLVYMDGSTSQRNKQRAVDQFQDDPDTRIVLGQLSAIGEGWTLTAASNAVFSEFYWVPGKNDQLLDRLHRRGQRRAVTGHLLVVPGSLDERVASTIIEKDKHIYSALDETLDLIYDQD